MTPSPSGGSTGVPPARRPAGSRILVLTGPSRAGKTTVCRRVVAEARSRGLSVAGVLTEDGTTSDGARLQYVVDLRTGSRRLLAAARPGGSSSPSGVPDFGWSFDEEGMAFGRLVLEACAGSDGDVLVVDQLGPLEVLAGRGWTVAFDLIGRGGYGLAIVVVNPRVLDEARSRLGDCETIVVTRSDRDDLPAIICSAHLPAG